MFYPSCRVLLLFLFLGLSGQSAFGQSDKYRTIELTNPQGDAEVMMVRKASYLLGKNLSLRSVLRLQGVEEAKLGPLNKQISQLAKGLELDLSELKTHRDFSQFWEMREQVLGKKKSVAERLRRSQSKDCEGLFRLAAELNFAVPIYTTVSKQEAENELGKKQLEMSRIMKFNIESALIQSGFENRLEAVRAIDITVDWMERNFPDGAPFRRVVRETFDDIEWMLETEKNEEGERARNEKAKRK